LTSNNYKLRCVGCGEIVSEQDSVARCNFCSEALDVEFDFAELKKRVKREFKKADSISAKKYLAFYPLKKNSKIVSLDEGNTPLTKVPSLAKELRQPNLLIKNEGMNPTGVFKDRGSLVEISKALELGAKAVVCASTGNMAASVSAYSAVAGLPCYVLIPENTPLGKLAQAMSYGARVLSIRGTYADCCELAEQMAKKYNFYLAGDYAFRSEGQKTIAFEIVEQLSQQVPDVVIVPVGCGTNLAAIWKGFTEFKKLGLIKKLPKMIGVQPEGCATVVAAFEKGSDKSPFVRHPKTICSAVGIGKPLDDVKALAAIRDSKGIGITVTDSEVVKAQRDMGEQEAIFVEPSAALPLAAVRKLKKKRFLKKSDTVVLIATGVGLKDPRSALDLHPTPPAVEPEMSEIDRFLKYKLYAIRSAGFSERKKVLFRRLPTLKKLTQVIRKEFSANLKDSHLKEISLAIETFLAKGKVVVKADLQGLVEESLSDLTYEKRVMRVRDYQLSIKQKKQPQAKVEIKFLGKILRASAKGVGPVDAVITAIRKALNSKSPLKESLVDFEVFVDADGVDATTEVKMKLEDSKKNFVVAVANSPDIITASIAAFEKGYNILYWKGEKS
jgi:threonine synthase